MKLLAILSMQKEININLNQRDIGVVVKKEHQKHSFHIGARFANITITHDGIRDNKHNLKFPCKCNCGKKYLMTKRQLISKYHYDSQYCKSCRPVTWKREPKEVEMHGFSKIEMAFMQGQLEDLDD